MNAATIDDSERRWSNDRGATSLAVVLLTPVFLVLMFMAVQAALWSHAQTEVRVAAADAAAQVARFDASEDAAKASVRSRLAGNPLTDIDVGVAIGADLVVVTVSARSQGIIIGTSRPVSATAAVPIERVRP